MKIIKNNIVIALFFCAILFVNFLAGAKQSNNNSISLKSICQTTIAQAEEADDCDCPPGKACVNGVCVLLERSDYDPCSMQELCYIFNFIPVWKSCEGHKYNCVAHPTGIKNCSATNCACDQSPC